MKASDTNGSARGTRSRSATLMLASILFVATSASAGSPPASSQRARGSICAPNEEMQRRFVQQRIKKTGAAFLRTADLDAKVRLAEHLSSLELLLSRVPVMPRHWQRYWGLACPHPVSTKRRRVPRAGRQGGTKTGGLAPLLQKGDSARP